MQICIKYYLVSVFDVSMDFAAKKNERKNGTFDKIDKSKNGIGSFRFGCANPLRFDATPFPHKIRDKTFQLNTLKQTQLNIRNARPLAIDRQTKFTFKTYGCLLSNNL